MATNKWLTNITGIEEGTPYHCKITPSDEMPSDASPENMPSDGMNGIAIFKMRDDSLHFDFTGNRDTHPLAQSVIAISQLPVISVPDIGFTSNFYWNSLSADHRRIGGVIAGNHFGDENLQLDGVSIELNDLPKNWRGTNEYLFYQASAEFGDIQIESDVATIKHNHFGITTMKGVKMEAGGWQVDLLEVPPRTNNEGTTPYQCNLNKTYGSMTGIDVQRFIEENLFPFLMFVFGQRIRFRTIVGYKEGVEQWAIPGRGTHPQARTYQRNWFTMQVADPIDLQPLFQSFCEADTSIKDHWREIIDQYADSEEIIATLGSPTKAASISFAGIDGLTRSIISSLPSKDEWLRKDLSLKGGKRIIDAIEVAAQAFFGKNSETFKQASGEIQVIRNATFHTDLTTKVSPTEAHYRWQASQFLIEALLLVQLGLNSIPNRTVHHTFKILGHDMFADVRSEELRFPSQ